MPDAPWSGPQAEDDLNEKEKSMRDALTEAADLLTDLKTAYEKLGYEIEARASYIRVIHGGSSSIVETVTPDLCKEMKDWMVKHGYGITVGLDDTGALVSLFIGQMPYYTGDVYQSEELAVLRAFLEVTKEKSE